MADYYVDWDDGDDGTGDGSLSTPWLTIEANIGGLSSGDVLHVFGDVTQTEAFSGSGIVIPAGVTLKAYTGYGPSGASDWPLLLTESAKFDETVTLGAGSVLDGFEVQNVRSSQATRAVYVNGSGAIVQNCKIQNPLSGGAFQIDEGSAYNCLAIGLSGEACLYTQDTGTVVCKNCVFAGGDYGHGSFGGSGSVTFSACIFYGHATATTDATGDQTGSYNATDQGSQSWGSNWVDTALASGDFEDDASADYRAAAGSSLVDADAGHVSIAVDFEGTSRPINTNEDIGYYERPAAGGGTVEGAAADGADFSDAADAQIDLQAAAADAIDLSDAAEALATLQAAAAEGIDLADAAVVVTAVDAQAADAIDLSDASAAQADLQAAAADGLTLADIAAAIATLFGAAADGALFSDAATGALDAATIDGAAADLAVFSDAAVVTVIRACTAADAVALSDAATVQAALQTLAADGATFADAAALVQALVDSRLAPAAVYRPYAPDAVYRRQARTATYRKQTTETLL